MRKLILTFDVEDFINVNAVHALLIILKILKKYKLRAIFFITGHMAEKLINFPNVLDMIKKHEIGYHSSSHSVRPIILEFTDVKSYRKAHSISLERETTHINPLTGKLDGNGGIHYLQDLFHPKKITSFRAPGMSWTPPHLDALADLGIKFDFSSNITISEPIHYRRVTFYPYTFTQQWEGSLSAYKHLTYALMNRKVAVLDLHPTLYVNQNMWDSIYYKDNPQALFEARKRNSQEAESLIHKFELLMKRITFLRHMGLIEIDSKPETCQVELITNKNMIYKFYKNSIKWSQNYFNYTPLFAYDHFYEFFEAACQ